MIKTKTAIQTSPSRRRQKRFQTNIICQITVLNETKRKNTQVKEKAALLEFQEERNASIDISMGGLLIKARRKYPIGSIVKLDLIQDHGLLTFIALITRIHKNSDREYHIGLEFYRTEPANLKILRSLLHEKEK